MSCLVLVPLVGVVLPVGVIWLVVLPVVLLLVVPLVVALAVTATAGILQDKLTGWLFATEGFLLNKFASWL